MQTPTYQFFSYNKLFSFSFVRVERKLSSSTRKLYIMVPFTTVLCPDGTTSCVWLSHRKSSKRKLCLNLWNCGAFDNMHYLFIDFLSVSQVNRVPCSKGYDFTIVRITWKLWIQTNKRKSFPKPMFHFHTVAAQGENKVNLESFHVTYPTSRKTNELMKP